MTSSSTPSTPDLSDAPQPRPDRFDIRRLLLFLLVQQALFVALGAGLWVWSGRALAGFVTFGSRDVLLGLAFAAAAIVPLHVLFRASPALRARMAREMGRTLFATTRPLTLGAILLVSFSAGIGEEALFRGGIQMFAGAYLPAWAAILLASALFAAAHPGSPTLMAFITAISLALGVAYALSGSLAAVMIAHSLLDIWGCFNTQAELRRLDHWDDSRLS